MCESFPRCVFGGGRCARTCIKKVNGVSRRSVGQGRPDGPSRARVGFQRVVNPPPTVSSARRCRSECERGKSRHRCACLVDHTADQQLRFGSKYF